MRALLTGSTGQDGSYLAELLLGKGYEVFGLVRRSSERSFSRISHLRDRLILISGDVSDLPSVMNAVRLAQPNEVYNLAAQSFVPASWDAPRATFDTNTVGTFNVLEATRQLAPDAKVYQASTSEMFGNADAPQSETTPLGPMSPYAVSKVAAHGMVNCFRKQYGLFACAGILFNHESPRRGDEFVTQKIAKAAAATILAYRHYTNQAQLKLGNLEARRDWGYAPEYVEAMWLMLQQSIPQDYVIATGTSCSVAEFCEAAYGAVNIDWTEWVTTDPQLTRTSEVYNLVGDASLAKNQLGWEPKTCGLDVARKMVEAEVRRIKDKGDPHMEDNRNYGR